ncbi:MAG: NmrA/HSCARG family protein [Sedimentisphaerales bacterium]|nr:NmrA/HSCARG family protein [Sedimentisphaerales bacterium]
MDAKNRTILVVGATGAQGGSAARHLLSRGKFAVRALTRHPDSDKAAALRKAGAEVVQGDLDDRESLRAALKGCYGAFGVTNFWEHFEQEYGEGKNLLDAVASAGLTHFVFSTLPYCKKISGGTLEVPHFDLKAQLEEYARRLKLNATFIHCAFYFENFLFFLPPKRQDDGTFAFGFPQGDVPLAGVSVEDMGSIVAPIFERPDEYLGKVVGIVGDDLTGAQYAEKMARILGNKVVYNHIPRETFASFGFPGAEDLANMFEFNRLYIPNRQADLHACRALNPKMQTFETWLKSHRGAFDKVFGREQAATR